MLKETSQNKKSIPFKTSNKTRKNSILALKNKENSNNKNIVLKNKTKNIMLKQSYDNKENINRSNLLEKFENIKFDKLTKNYFNFRNQENTPLTDSTVKKTIEEVSQNDLITSAIIEYKDNISFKDDVIRTDSSSFGSNLKNRKNVNVSLFDSSIENCSVHDFREYSDLEENFEEIFYENKKPFKYIKNIGKNFIYYNLNRR